MKGQAIVVEFPFDGAWRFSWVNFLYPETRVLNAELPRAIWVLCCFSKFTNQYLKYYFGVGKLAPKKHIFIGCKKPLFIFLGRCGSCAMLKIPDV